MISYEAFQQNEGTLINFGNLENLKCNKLKIPNSQNIGKPYYIKHLFENYGICLNICEFCVGPQQSVPSSSSPIKRYL